MANIRQFVNPIDKLQPTEMGSEAREIEGRHIGADIDIAGRFIGGAITDVGNQIQEEHNLAAQAQISDYYTKKDIQLRQITNDWLSKQDVSDPQLSGRYAEEVLDPALNEGDPQWEGMSRRSQQFAEAHKAQLRNVYAHQVMTDASVLGGIAAGNMFNDYVKQQSPELLHDPTQLGRMQDELWGKFNYSIDQNPNLSPAVKKQLQTEVNERSRDLAKAGALGSIYRNAYEFRDAVDRGDWDKSGLNGGELAQLRNEADVRIKGLEATADRDIALKDRIERKDWDAHIADLDGRLPQMLSQPGGAKKIEDELFLLSKAPGAQVGAIDAIRGQVREFLHPVKIPVVDDQNTVSYLSAKADTGDLEYGELLQAELHGQISHQTKAEIWADQRNFNSNPANRDAMRRFDAFVNSQKPAFPIINSNTGQMNQFWKDRYDAASAEARRVFRAAIARGDSPDDFFDGASPKYLGGVFAKYQDPRQKPNILLQRPTPTLRAGHEQEDFDALPPGPFIGPDGKMRVKPK